MINWGVIGAGGIAYRRTIPEGFINSKNSKLIGIVDIDMDIANKIGKERKINVYKNTEELLEDKNIDAVYIATPVYLHYEQCIKAAAKRKHILCEKIMALSAGKCRKIIKICKLNNVKFAIAYMMRFNSIHKKIKEIVKSGELGNIIMGRSQLSCWYPPISGAWRQKKELAGGGSLADMGSHCIDILEYIFDSRVKEVSCYIDNIIHNYDVEDTSIVNCKFENGAFGIIDNCFNIPDSSSKNILEIYGSKGSILCRGTIGQDSDGSAEIFIEKKETGYNAEQKRLAHDKAINLEFIPANIYQSEIEYFTDCIEKNIEPEISGELGLHHVKIIEACYESAKYQKVIKLQKNLK